MELLFLLMERRGQLMTREEIIEKGWGKDVFVLKDDPEFIGTVTTTLKIVTG